MDANLTFNSVEEECRHWKAEARKYYQEYMDVKEEMDEFQEGSRQLEAELEASLEQKEKLCRDLTMQTQQMQKETESLYKRLVSSQADYTKLEQKSAAVTEERDRLKAYTRELEQVNDDLERAQRVVTETVAGFESMLHQAYEKNALLEIEVDEKEMLQVKLQRLMDETRDLKQELNVRPLMGNAETSGSRTSLNSAAPLTNGHTKPDATPATHPPADPPMETDVVQPSTVRPSHIPQISHNHHPHHNPIPTKTESTTGSSTAHQNPIKHSENILNGNAMSASSRLSALNLVAELLRKVNVMEARLKACRTAMPPPRHHLSSSGGGNSIAPATAHSIHGHASPPSLRMD